MTPTAALTPVGGPLGSRFLLVSYLPTLGNAVVVLLLVAAGAPGTHPELRRAWQAASNLGAVELLLLCLTITFLAFLSHPLQSGLVRLLAGNWPLLLRPLAALAVERHRRRRNRLFRATVLTGQTPTQAQINQAGAIETTLRQRYPPAEFLPAPTSLGNTLAALECLAGAAHGLDPVVTWPRLYPLLRPPAKAVVDDHRDSMDAGCRLAATSLLTALVTATLVWQAPRSWWLAPTALLMSAWLAYRGAVRSALSYSLAVDAAIDTHRFLLYEALQLPVPHDPAAERAFNAQLCLHWRQNRPHPDVVYRQPEASLPITDS